MTTPEQIAKGLTPKERACLDWVRPYSIIAMFRFHREVGTLCNVGLLERLHDHWVGITPLGLSVREVFKGEG